MIRILLLLFPVVMAAAPLQAAPETSFARYWNKGRGYAPFLHATGDGIVIDNSSCATLIDSCLLQNPVTDFSLTFRVSNINSKPGCKYPYTKADGAKGSVANPPWGFFISPQQGKKTWFSVIPVEKDDPFSSAPALRIVVNTEGDDSPVYSTTVGSGLNPYDGANVWRLAKSGDCLILSAGDRGMTELASVGVSGKCRAFGFAVTPGGRIRVTDISLQPGPPIADLEAGEWNDTGKLDRYFADSDDSLEGFWTVFDRTLDESLLRLGGDYRLAIVRNGGKYDIIYIDGAITNAGKWKTGMTKGSLIPDSFPGIFNVEWIDAEGRIMRNGIKAQTGEGGTLLLQFPYQSSTLRLRRLPASRR